MTPEQIVVTSIQGAISIGILFAVLWRNNILKAQIQKSDTIISQMETYTKMLDIEKIKQIMQMKEEVIVAKTELEKQQFEAKFNQELETYKKDKNEFVQNLSETAEVLLDMVFSLYDSRQDRREFINNRLPKTGKIFLQVLEHKEKDEIPKTKNLLEVTTTTIPRN